MHKSLEEGGDDALSAWMAHYIAEQMVAAEFVQGEAKEFAKRECFKAILTLWDYQACFPYDQRPFKNFDAVFRALEHIDVNKANPSYFRNKNQDGQPPKEIEKAMDCIISLDSAARIIISFLVKNSMLSVIDESTLEWLRAIDGIVRSDEARILLKFMPELDEASSAQDQHERRKKELSEHIGRLELFESLSREIKSVLENELETLTLGH